MIKIIAEIGWNHCGDLDLAKECNNDGCVIDIEKLLI